MHTFSKTIGAIVLALSLTIPAMATEVASGASSHEALAKEVLSAMSAKDQKALERLQISADEFKHYVWPAMASRVSGPNMNAEKFYVMFQKSSAAGLQSSAELLGGKEWQVVSVTPGAEKKASKGVRLYDAPTFIVRDAAGQEKRIKLLGGVLEQNGSFKATSYYVTPQQQQK